MISNETGTTTDKDNNIFDEGIKKVRTLINTIDILAKQDKNIKKSVGVLNLKIE